MAGHTYLCVQEKNGEVVMVYVSSLSWSSTSKKWRCFLVRWAISVSLTIRWRVTPGASLGSLSSTGIMCTIISWNQGDSAISRCSSQDEIVQAVVYKHAYRQVSKSLEYDTQDVAIMPSHEYMSNGDTQQLNAKPIILSLNWNQS